MALLLKILTIIGLLATTVILLLGVIQMFNAKSDAQTNNQIMRWRVILQTITLLTFTALLVFGRI